VLFVAALLLMGAAHLIELDLRSVLSEPVQPTATTIANVAPPAQEGAPSLVVRQPQDVTVQQEFVERFSRMWDDVKEDFAEGDYTPALAGGALATLTVFVIFVAATRLPPLPKTWGAGESREDRFDSSMLHGAAIVLLLITALVCSFIRQRKGDTSGGYILEPFLVLAGARIVNVLIYPLIGRADIPRHRYVHLWSREFPVVVEQLSGDDHIRNGWCAALRVPADCRVRGRAGQPLDGARSGGLAADRSTADDGRRRSLRGSAAPSSGGASVPAWSGGPALCRLRRDGRCGPGGALRLRQPLGGPWASLLDCPRHRRRRAALPEHHRRHQSHQPALLLS
jgi:hypothetical protein